MGEDLLEVGGSRVVLTIVHTAGVTGAYSPACACLHHTPKSHIYMCAEREVNEVALECETSVVR